MKVYTCFPGGKAKALTMSYDDGKLQDKRLIGIFNKYGIKATPNSCCFVVFENACSMPDCFAGGRITPPRCTE